MRARLIGAPQLIIFLAATLLGVVIGRQIQAPRDKLPALHYPGTIRVGRGPAGQLVFPDTIWPGDTILGIGTDTQDCRILVTQGAADALNHGRKYEFGRGELQCITRVPVVTP